MSAERARSAVRGLAPVVLVALAAAPAHAAGDAREVIWQAINLAILLGVLVYFARKPIQVFFADRRSQIESDLEESARLLETAETRYAEWQRKLVALEQETEKIRNDGLHHAEDDAARILSDAQAAAERIHSDAEAAIEQELRRAQGVLRAEAVALATQLAGTLLAEQLVDNDRERLLDEFIVGVEPGSGTRETN